MKSNLMLAIKSSASDLKEMALFFYHNGKGTRESQRMNYEDYFHSHRFYCDGELFVSHPIFMYFISVRLLGCLSGTPLHNTVESHCNQCRGRNKSHRLIDKHLKVTRPDTRLLKLRAGGQGLYLR